MTATASTALGSQEPDRTTKSLAIQADPTRNPSYPPRIHFREREAIEAKLRACDDQLATMARKLSGIGNHPSRLTYERLYHQMLGARDQLAEAARRIPLETGALYEEDQERLSQAEAAAARTLERWNAVKA